MIQEKLRVILYGDSLLLAGIQASLSASQNLKVIPLDGPPAALADHVRDLHPSAVIFDLGSIQPDFLSCLSQLHDLLLIGLDPETHRAQVWAGRQEAAVGARDLLEIIQNKKE